MYGLNLQNPKDKGHRSEVEVIPDAYKLSITFTSCLANNMNTAVFQYYVQMTYYDGGNEKTDQDPGQEQEAKALEEIEKQLVKKGVVNGEPLQAPEPATEGGGEGGGGGEAPAPSGPVKSARSSTRIGGRQARDFTQEIMELVEKFDESTYNKKLGKLNTAVGDQTVNSDGVIATIRKTSKVIRESTEFLSRLYNAEDNKLWYREFEQDELYTTLKPDYRQILKKKYAELMKSMRKVQTDIDLLTSAIERNKAELRKTLDVSKRTPILERNVDLTRKVNELMSQKNDLADKIIRTDTDLVQSAFDEHDEVVSVKRKGVGIRMFKQVWNEKIMNPYEKDKLQYLTSEEKNRYFKEKIRELNKIDKHGVLNHPDWFFRVVVLDYIVQQMKKLVLWFKNCSWDDFETIYRIVRKLKMLHLDVDSICSDDKFDINKTNLFYISDEEMSQFTKIDDILTGNTLYEIFSNQVRLNFTKTQNKVESSSKMTSDEMKEIMRERTTEEDIERRRTVRQQVVTRYWGSESALTKEAYDIANRGSSQDVGDDVDFDTIATLKNEIIQLKLTNPDDNALKEKLGQFTGYIRIIKESLVMKKMNEMNQLAGSQMEIKDGSVNAKVVKPE